MTVALGRSDQDEQRGAVLTGPLTLTTPDEVMTTPVVLHNDHCIVPAPGGPTVLHVWGTAHLRLQGSPCVGPAAWSFYYDPPQGFGAISVHCQNGSGLAGRLALTGFQEPGQEHQLWRLELRLDKASYVTRF